ncbi:MAG TPA: hypothetical protein VLE22_14595 [Bryobacteraceae bacterium]|nr:hypothetical protein [Bryobacteraceae bacterium]
MPVANGKAGGPAELVRQNTGRLRPIGFTAEGTLYYSLENRGSDIYSADLGPDTSKAAGAPKPLIERFMGKNANPVWAPDGKRLAYYSMRGHPPTMGVLSIRNEETGEEVDLYPKLAWFKGLSWFPEGRSLLAYGVDLTNTMAYFRIDAETGEVNKLFDVDFRGLVPWAVLSPDGKRLYNLGPRGLVEHDLANGGERAVARPPKGAEFVELAMSPDGKFLATKLNKSPYSLAILPVDTGEVREVLTIPPPNWFLSIAWTPDSRYLLSAKQFEVENERAELWRVAVATGEAQSLGLSFQSIRDLSIHPNGRRIAFTYAHRTSEIWAMENLGTGSAR